MLGTYPPSEEVLQLTCKISLSRYLNTILIYLSFILYQENKDLLIIIKKIIYSNISNNY